MFPLRGPGTSPGNKRCPQHKSDISKQHLRPHVLSISFPRGRAPFLNLNTHSSELSELVRPSSGTARVCGGTDPMRPLARPSSPLQTEGGSHTSHLISALSVGAAHTAARWSLKGKTIHEDLPSHVRKLGLEFKEHFA